MLRRLRPLKALATCALMAPLLLSFTAYGAADEATDEVIVNMLRSLGSDMRALREELRQLRSEVSRLSVAVNRPAGRASNRRYTLTLSDEDILAGDTDAPLIIVEYFDYQCPLCSKFFRRTYPRVKSSYVDTGKARYLVRHFPLEFNQQARQAALAGHCAHQQGRFWPMHEALMARQGQLSAQALLDSAAAVGLDVDQFNICMRGDDQRKVLTRQIEAAKRLGVRGAPTFFVGRLVNGQVVEAQRIAGAQTYRTFKKALDSFR